MRKAKFWNNTEVSKSAKFSSFFVSFFSFNNFMAFRITQNNPKTL